MPTWRTIASVAAAAALSVLAATAVVDAKSSGGQLEACAGARGELRLVAAGEACVTGGQRVSWSAVGPTGPPGASGPPGATGARGPAGPRGRTGKIKLNGSTQVALALKLIHKRVKAVGEQVSAANGKLTALDGKVAKAAALGQRAYERIYHVCLGVESAKNLGYGNTTAASVGIARCKYGFYGPWPGYDPEP